MVSHKQGLVPAVVPLAHNAVDEVFVMLSHLVGSAAVQLIVIGNVADIFPRSGIPS